MAATDTNILREFLVSLGFKVENAERFKQTIEDATKMVGKFGTALEAMGIAALGALNKVANKYRDLEYASQRLNGTPIRSIMAFQQAMKLSGTTVEDARSSLEGFGDFLRSNPNGLNIMKSLGISTTDAKGNLRPVTDMLYQFGNLAKQWASQGQLFKARGYADMLGISKESLDALMRNPQAQANKYIQDLDKRGITEQEIKKRADAMARWAQRWDDFTGRLAVFTDMWISKVQPIFDHLMDFLKSADKQTNGLAVQFLALGAALLPILTFGNPLIAVIAGIVGGLALLFEDFKNWQKTGKSIVPWAEWSPELKEIWEDIKNVGKVLGEVFGGASLGNLGKVLTGFVKDELGALKDMLDAILHGLNAIKQFKSGNVKGGLGELGNAARSAGKSLFVDQYNTLKDQFHNWTGGRSDQTFNNLQHGAQDLAHRAAPYAQQALKFGQSAATQAAQFLSQHGVNAENIKGILAGIYAESGLNPNARNPTSGAFGIGQWLGGRKKELFRRYGNNPNLQQQLEFLLYELTGGDRGGRSVLSANTSDAALSAYVNNFMRPGPGASGDMKRGRAWLAQNGGGDNYQQVNVKTDIYVNGSGDPNQTAEAVARQQQRVYGNTLRYNKPAAS